MRVTIFTAFDTALNPYILLFKQALESQGLRVRFWRNFNLYWLISKGKFCDCIHLHWLQLFFIPPKKNIRFYLFRRLIENRFVKAFLDFLCLVDFALTFLFAKLTGKTIVFTVHDLFQFGKQSFRWKIQIQIARYIIFLMSDSIHVHNRFTRKLIETQYNRKRGIAVIPHGSYIGYYPNHVSKSEARRNLGLPDDAFVYLFLGLLRPYKGLEDLFDAFKKLEESKARLLVAGRVFGVDNYESKLEKLIRDDSRIKLVPEFIPDESIQIYFNASDIFVLPYKDITTSGAAALALSFGRPVLAPRITSFPEIVTPMAGILYDTAKPNALDLALNEAIKQSWSESQILEYAHQFDWAELGPQLAELYRKDPKEKIA
jgi:glycosyltransferase involved in cell wall biosynthesis